MRLNAHKLCCPIGAMLLVGLSAGGCGLFHRHSAIEPLRTPAAATTVTHYIGTPLSGALATSSVAASSTDAWDVSVRWVALEKTPASAMWPLASSVRLIVSSRGGSPLLPVTSQTAAVRWAAEGRVDSFAASVDGDRYGRASVIANQRGVLPAGDTAAFTANDADQTVTIAASRGADVKSLDGVEFSITLESAGRREVAVINKLAASADGIHAAMTMPFVFASSDATAIAAFIDLTPAAPGPTHDAAYASAQKQIADSQAAAAASGGKISADFSNLSAVKSAVASLARAGDHRGSLTYLAGETGASLCGDVALLATPSDNNTLAAAVLANLPADQPLPNPAAMRWLLDRSALKLVSDKLTAASKQSADTGDSPLSPELAAVIDRYAGEAGRHSGSLEPISRSSSSEADLDARLIAENKIFLEDSSPASRVRSFDWLNGRGLGPAGFDPLGTPKARRAALENMVIAVPGTTTAPATSP